MVPLQLVAAATKTGAWRFTAERTALELVVDGLIHADVFPWTEHADGTGALTWRCVTTGGRSIGATPRVADACRLAAADAGVTAPVPPELLAGLGDSPATCGLAPAELEIADGLLERFADLLAAILDEPLATLPGSDPGGGREPLELRLAHYRPDLSERAAVLLEEAGR